MNSFIGAIVFFVGRKPYQATEGSAYDLYADRNVRLGSKDFEAIETGTSVIIPEGYQGWIIPRSGLALKHGISVLNSPGLIDSDYRGEIKVILVNHGAEEVSFNEGERIAQLVIMKKETSILTEITSDEFAKHTTKRGKGGFGSTGLN